MIVSFGQGKVTIWVMKNLMDHMGGRYTILTKRIRDLVAPKLRVFCE